MAVVCGRAQRRLAVQAVLDRGSPLQLMDRLARIELRRHSIGLARIGFPLPTREPEGVLRVRLRLLRADERDPRPARELEGRLRVDQIALCCRMVAVAV